MSKSIETRITELEKAVADCFKLISDSKTEVANIANAVAELQEINRDHHSMDLYEHPIQPPVEDKCKSCKYWESQCGTGDEGVIQECICYSAYEPKVSCKTCGGSGKVQIDGVWSMAGGCIQPCLDCTKEAEPKESRIFCKNATCDFWSYADNTCNMPPKGNYCTTTRKCLEAELIAELDKLPQKK
jgi:hypothetical protein